MAGADFQEWVVVDGDQCRMYEQEFNKSMKIKDSLNDWKKIPLLIGVTGNSGVGKSSFIDAVRGIRPNQKGAAKTGVTETTTTVKYFPHPENEMLKLADLPGVGTPNFLRNNYCKAVEFDKMDMFIIITASRFTENDLWLVKEITRRKKIFLLLRTRVAFDLENAKEDEEEEYQKLKDDFLRAKIDEIRKSIEAHLQTELGELDRDKLKVFLVDSKKTRHPFLDFSEFTETVIENFPRFKKETLILTLSHLTPALIDEKEKILRGRIWKTALLSAAGGVIPIPGTSLSIDTIIIIYNVKEYRQQFGLETDALEKLAESVNSTASEICASAGLMSVSFELTTAGILRLCSGLVVRSTIQNITSYIPIAGQIFGGVVSYKGTAYSLGKLLGIMAEDARKVQHHIKTRLYETEL